MSGKEEEKKLTRETDLFFKSGHVTRHVHMAFFQRVCRRGNERNVIDINNWKRRKNAVSLDSNKVVLDMLKSVGLKDTAQST